MGIGNKFLEIGLSNNGYTSFAPNNTVRTQYIEHIVSFATLNSSHSSVNRRYTLSSLEVRFVNSQKSLNKWSCVIWNFYWCTELHKCHYNIYLSSFADVQFRILYKFQTEFLFGVSRKIGLGLHRGRVRQPWVHFSWVLLPYCILCSAGVNAFGFWYKSSSIDLVSRSV